MSKEQWLKENLREGEVYAGLILGENGAPDHHVILLPWKPNERMSWPDAMKAKHDALAAARQPVEAEPVGATVAMPGSGGGFTMCAFNASDVPVGTKLYTTPPAALVDREAVIEKCARKVESFFIGYRHDDEDLAQIAAAIRALKKGEGGSKYDSRH